MKVWTKKLGGDAKSLFTVDILDDQGAVKVKDIDDFIKAINNSSIRLNAPERFGTGAVRIYAISGERLDPAESLFEGIKLKYNSLRFTEPVAKPELYLFDHDGSIPMLSLTASKVPSATCKAYQGDLRKEGLGIFKNCPICEEDGILCQVGRHPPALAEPASCLLDLDGELLFSTGIL